MIPLRTIFIAGVFLLCSLMPLVAQPRDSSRLVRMYGVGDEEFLISAYLATASPDSVGDLWNFARSMGVTTIQPGGPSSSSIRSPHPISAIPRPGGSSSGD